MFVIFCGWGGEDGSISFFLRGWRGEAKGVKGGCSFRANLQLLIYTLLILHNSLMVSGFRKVGVIFDFSW